MATRTTIGGIGGDRVAGSGRELVDRIGELMSASDVDALVDMYDTDARVVLYHRVASGHDEIRELLASSLASYGLYKVLSVDQFQHTGDLVMWDATVETTAGPLLTTHVVVLNHDGLIDYHVPSVRGYWGW